MIQLIISLLSDKSKRLLRSTNKLWRERIDTHSFTFYFTSATTIPHIVDHLLLCYRYKPLSITFAKSIRPQLKDFAPHLIRLTNLRSIRCDFETLGPANRGVSLLSVLTNLEELIPFPCDLFGAFPKLKKLPQAFMNLAQAKRHLPVYENLEDMSLHDYGYDAFSLIKNPSRLTKLEISFSSIKVTEDTNGSIERLSNLKGLTLSQHDISRTEVQIRSLTNLEKLCVKCVITNGIEKLTQLKTLVISHPFTDSQLLLVSNLCNLKSLAIENIKLENNILKLVLPALTALEYLSQQKGCNNQDINDSLAAITSTRLTHLDLYLFAPKIFNSNNFSRLIQLQKLNIVTNPDDPHDIDYNGLSYLTSLTYLDLKSVLPHSLTSVYLLTNLKELHMLPHARITAMIPLSISLSKLTNLEVLDLRIISETTFNEMHSLSNLTSLSVFFNQEFFENNNNNPLAALNKLKVFYCYHLNQVEAVWSQISRLTALESLLVSSLANEDQILSLTSLSHLTWFRVCECHHLSGTHLTLLTNLQRIYFRSKKAEEMVKRDPSITNKFPYLVCLSFTS